MLRARYAALQPDGHDCLITHLVSLAERQGVVELEGIEHPWDVPGLPPSTRRAALHARRLSLLARGATLQYHRMLIEKKGEEEESQADQRKPTPGPPVQIIKFMGVTRHNRSDVTVLSRPPFGGDGS